MVNNMFINLTYRKMLGHKHTKDATPSITYQTRLQDAAHSITYQTGLQKE